MGWGDSVRPGEPELPENRVLNAALRAGLEVGRVHPWIDGRDLVYTVDDAALRAMAAEVYLMGIRHGRRQLAERPGGRGGGPAALPLMYVRVRDGEVRSTDTTHAVDSGVLLDLDGRGRVVGVEIIGVIGWEMSSLDPLGEPVSGRSDAPGRSG